MDNFNIRLISSIHVTEEIALRINILENKRKREVAAAAQVNDRFDKAHEQAKNIMASIVVDTNPTAESKSIRLAQYQEDMAQEQEDVVPDIGLTRTFPSSKRHSSTIPEDLSECWGLSLAHASLALIETTQSLTRWALMTLVRRYRSKQMFDMRLIHATMSTNTIYSRCHSIYQYK